MLVALFGCSADAATELVFQQSNLGPNSGTPIVTHHVFLQPPWIRKDSRGIGQPISSVIRDDRARKTLTLTHEAKRITENEDRAPSDSPSGPSSKGIHAKVRWGQVTTVEKWKCHMAELMAGATKVSEVCVASAGDLGLSETEAKLLRHVGYVVPGESGKIAILRRVYRNGMKYTEETLLKVRTGLPNLKASGFEIPKGYRK